MRTLITTALLAAVILPTPPFPAPAGPADSPGRELPPPCRESGWTEYTATRAAPIPLIWEEMQEHRIMGLSIALVDDQKLVWARGFGYADLDDGVWATESTVYRIGSNSKTITGLAVMKAQEEGLLDIDDPLPDYPPSSPSTLLSGPDRSLPGRSLTGRCSPTTRTSPETSRPISGRAGPTPTGTRTGSSPPF